ncbi:MAG: hypothetical protein ACR2NZ_20355 [Rubripirellula sp.]
MNQNAIETNEPTPERPRRMRRRAIQVSILFHAILLIVLLCWYVPRKSPTPEQKPAVASVDQTGDSSGRPDAYPVPKQNPEVPPDQIVASIESQIERAEKLSSEKQLTELEQQLKKLESISDAESVSQVTKTIADSLGLPPGAVPSSEPPEGEFDFDSAQLDDVTRLTSDDGWIYQSVLVDAEGRTQTVPMDAADGETAYNAFQQMKRYPMAAGIYRQIVMPMMQRMIEASDAAERAAESARELQRQESANGSDEGYLDVPDGSQDATTD